MPKPLLSIVMPAYGVEAYIAKAIEAILAQSYDNWELIVVDDASPDKSGEIAAEFAKSDSRIKVIRHTENRWLGEARNTGIKHSNGRYVWFVDPDDLYDSELISKCMNMLIDHPADAIMFGHVERYFSEDGKLLEDREVCPPNAILETKSQLRAQILEYEKLTCYGYAWNKIYDLERIKKLGLSFSSSIFIEDITFNVKYFQDAQSLDVISEPLYFYGKREASNITNTFKPEYYELHRKRIEMLTEQQRSWGLLDESSRSTLGSLMGRYILSALERNNDKRSGMDSKARRKWCEKVFADPLFCELMPYAKSSDSRALDICLGPLRSASVGKSLMLGKLIHFARNHMANIFRKLRSER